MDFEYLDTATDEEMDELEIVLEYLAARENISSKKRKPITDPLIAKIQAACASRFRAQARIAKKQLPHVEDSFDNDTAGDTPPASLMAGLIGALALAPLATDRFAVAVERATGSAYAHAGAEVAEKLGVAYDAIDLSADGHALAAELDQTTASRLENAIDDVYSKAEAEYSDLVAAVDQAFQDAIGSRAEMTAVTEIATAWNAGAADAAQAAIDSGIQIKKSWITEEDPCDDCQENADEGEIDFEDDFPSGDDQPPAHPNCRCSLEMRVTKE